MPAICNLFLCTLCVVCDLAIKMMMMVNPEMYRCDCCSFEQWMMMMMMMMTTKIMIMSVDNVQREQSSSASRSSIKQREH